MTPPFDSPRSVFDFHGGIHPPEHKQRSNQQPITSVPIPAQLILPLNMHLGAPAKPVVEIGQHVCKGEKIADANGLVSVPLHAPTSGKVIAIGPRPVQHPSGLDAPCIVIEPDGEERWCELHPVQDWQNRSPSTLIARLREAGIAGMGGAGFPTAVKLNLKEGTRIQQLLINAVECEPYITADDRLMRERADQIVAGIQILRHLIKPAEVLIGIEDNKPDAIESMRRACADTGIEVVVVPTKYPSGGEKQLIRLLTGKEVPSGGIPAQIGVVCQNVGTVVAIHRAIALGEPLISRITTLTGDAIASPGNVEVLLGTPVSHLLTCAGVNPGKLGRLVMGGPMMGFTLHSTDVPVVKTSNCIIAATAEELPEPAPEQPCIRCGSCAEVCPADLLPQQLYWYARSADLDRAQQYNLMDCIECGACAWVCPSNIPLVQYYRFAKGEVRAQVADKQKAEKARERFEARQARLEKDAAEKEARRQARLQASKQKAAPAPSADIKALKAASLEASSAYKAAVKALKQAQLDEADNVAALSAEVDALKARADAAKAAVRDAGNAPAAPAIDIKALKAASLDASSAYKAAVKKVKQAEAEGSDDVATLRAEAEALKAKADAAKAAVRGAASAPAAAPPQDPVAELKKQVGDASAAYKAAVKAAREAEQNDTEQNNADNLDNLRAEAERLKAEADKLKAALRDAKDAAPATAAPAQSAPAPAADPAAERAAQMKTLKARYNSLNKLWKEANAAFERAERDGSDNLDAQRQQVETLRQQADDARAALNELVDQAKAGIRASGSDLKTLKLEAARTDSLLRDKMKELDDAKRSADEERINLLYQERDALKRDAELAASALRSALLEQGLNE